MKLESHTQPPLALAASDALINWKVQCLRETVYPTSKNGIWESEESEILGICPPHQWQQQRLPPISMSLVPPPSQIPCVVGNASSFYLVFFWFCTYDSIVSNFVILHQIEMIHIDMLRVLGDG